MFVFTEPIKQGYFVGPTGRQDPSQGTGLDRVSDRRAGAVGLDVLDRRRTHAGRTASLAHARPPAPPGSAPSFQGCGHPGWRQSRG